MKQQKGFFLILIAFLFLIQEGVCRLLFPLPEIAEFNRIHYSPLSKTFHDHVKAQMNSSFRWTSDPDGASSIQSLNLYGFRSKLNWSSTKDPKTERVAFFGDSFVEGLLADESETIPAAYLQERIKQNPQIEVLNFGISGTSFADYFPLIRDTTKLFQPDRVVLVVTAGDIPPPEYQKSWLETETTMRRNSFLMPRIAIVLAKLIRGEVTPKRWHSAPYDYFQPVPNPSNPFTNKPDEEFSFIDSQILAAMKRGTLNPFLVDYISNAEDSLKRPVNAETHFAALTKFLADRKIKLTVIYFPHSLQVSDDYIQAMQTYSRNKNVKSLLDSSYQGQARELAEICKKHQISYLDLTPILRNQESFGKQMYWKFDGHPKGTAYVLAGKKAAQLDMQRSEIEQK